MSPDEEALRTFQSDWMKASANGDVEALLKMMADDVVFLVVGREPFGKDEFAALASAAGKPLHLHSAAEFKEIAVHGDLAYAWSHLEIAIKPAEGVEERKLAGHTLTIFRKRADGRWVLARDANLLQPVSAI